MITRPLLHDEGRIVELPIGDVADIGLATLPLISSFDWDEELLLLRNGVPAARFSVMSLMAMLSPDGMTFRVVNDTDTVTDENLNGVIL